MQITTVTVYSLRQILRDNVAGINVAGYTTKRDHGLFTYARDVPRGEYLGFGGNK